MDVEIQRVFTRQLLPVVEGFLLIFKDRRRVFSRIDIDRYTKRFIHRWTGEREKKVSDETFVQVTHLHS